MPVQARMNKFRHYSVEQPAKRSDISRESSGTRVGRSSPPDAIDDAAYDAKVRSWLTLVSDDD